ncbi:MAG TPA: winged helix-turn-helix domain-containing protein, partial [Stellaceae bacterium]|nr:winged helix-turn-helix domain-containing protein [Stellaceae bacterium]
LGLTFGRFRVLAERRELLADGRPIKLGGRAFDVLMALIEARGAVVSKDAMMARVWPGRTIEENSLAAQIAALRAAFAAERALIRTVSGRGYQFTGDIRVLPASPGEPVGAVAAPPASVLPPTNVPEPVSELIGREEELSEILNLVATHRLVTLTGAGGIGKTTLAIALARELRPHFTDGVWLAEFSALADPGLVPATVAAAVGLELSGGEVLAQRVAQALADRRVLLVLDTCEHVIAATATMAEAMLGASSAPHIIATSREPLRARGEWVYPVQPLAVPAVDLAADDDPLRYGAVRLFIERARAAEPHFAPDRRLIVMIASICRRLDGIPLAIELAAARASALGIETLAARLDDRFRLLTGGRRMAPARHQALRATLDWGYELLAEPERILLRRLAIFAGPFSLDAAAAIAASPELAVPDVIEWLTSLVAKSLVVTGGEGAVARYRLLDTTRAYALEKLGESGEHAAIAPRHAEYYRDLFERAETECETRPSAEWLADYKCQIDELRAVLDWAFLPDGDAAIGVALTAAAIPLWMHLSLMEECRGRVEHALAALDAGESRDARGEMKLHAALAASLMSAKGTAPEIGPAWAKAFEIAEKLDDAEYELRSLRGLWSFHIGNGQYRDALALAQKFSSLAADRSDSGDRLIGDRLIGISQHYLGEQFSARSSLERVLAHQIPFEHRSHIVRFQLDQRVTASAFLARILWLQGYPVQAMRAAESSVEDAQATNHAVSLCYAVTVAACPIAIWIGDLVAAEHYVEMLLDHSRHALALWHAFGQSHKGVLVIKRGDVVAGLRLLRASLGEIGEARSAFGLIMFLDVMAEALGRCGQIADGLAVTEKALACTERTEERWVIPELLRIKGELFLLQDAQGATAAAEDCFRQALDWARRQGALSWELRAAMSLARLLRDQHRSAASRALLEAVYNRFTEGFETADLKAAKALLDVLE